MWSNVGGEWVFTGRLDSNEQQQTKFTALGVPAVVGDLEKGLSEFLPGLDAVVFTAGSGHTGPDKTIDVDQDAAIRLIDDCRHFGLSRFVMISAIGADPLSDSPRIRNYLRAKGVATNIFAHPGWIIPSLLLEPLRTKRERGRSERPSTLAVTGLCPGKTCRNA